MAQGGSTGKLLYETKGAINVDHSFHYCCSDTFMNENGTK